MNTPTPWNRTSDTGKKIVLFLGGGILYSLIEIVARGYTHWSMTLTGGICLLIMYLRYANHPEDSILFKCFFGMCVITFFEFTVGCVVNLLLGWDVWDYSHMYLNVMGQICPSYSAGWFLLSLPVSMVCTWAACGRAFPGNRKTADGVNPSAA